MTAINYATQYSQALAQEFPYVLNFGALYNTPNNGRYKVTGAKTIEIPVLSTTGRVDGDRDTIGTPSRNYDNTWEPKVLANHREWETLIHPLDIIQTDYVASIANITKVYNEEQKFPEMDAYTISKIFSDWTGIGKTPTKIALTVANVLTQVDTMMQKMDEARVPVQGRILYVTPAVKTLLKNAEAIQRQLNVQSGNGAVSRNITRLDEVEIVAVPSDLMKTVYDFSVGWKAGTGAKQIQMLLIHPQAVITPTVYSFSSLDEPSAKTHGKYYYYEESFEDVFILNNKAGAIEFVLEADA